MVGVVDEHLLGVDAAGAHGHLQRVFDEALTHVTSELPADDHAAVDGSGPYSALPWLLSVRVV